MTYLIVLCGNVLSSLTKESEKLLPQQMHINKIEAFFLDNVNLQFGISFDRKLIQFNFDIYSHYYPKLQISVQRSSLSWPPFHDMKGAFGADADVLIKHRDHLLISINPAKPFDSFQIMYNRYRTFWLMEMITQLHIRFRFPTRLRTAPTTPLLLNDS